MGLSIIRFKRQQQDTPSWGALIGCTVHLLPWRDEQLRTVIENLESKRAQAERESQDTGLSMDEVILLSPLTQSSSLICQGLNYAQHQKESGLAKKSIDPEDNLLFIKSSASLCGARDDIVRPVECQLLDYEAELGLVIRQPIVEPVRVPAAALSDYLAGFIICNDVSSRDQQIGAPGLQWYKGKSYRTFCPAGPVLYLLDDGEIDYLDKLELKLWVNGELRQAATTAQLIHKPHDTLAYLSRFANLHPGDCLLTGTPGGVALKADLKTGLAILLNMQRDSRRKEKFTQAQKRKPNYLKDGDVVEVEITCEDGTIFLGRQRNTVTPELIA